MKADIPLQRGYVFLLYHKHAEYTMQRKLYVSPSAQKRRASYVVNVICLCFIIDTQSILCREDFVLLLHDRNAEYPMQRRFYDAAF